MSDTTCSNLPRYELRRKAQASMPSEYRLEIWQLPSPATPRLKKAEKVASLKGAPLRMIEVRITKSLNRQGINLAAFADKAKRTWEITEELALSLGLMFRALSPLKDLDRIRCIADGIEAMSREEAGYWLGMAMFREKPSRVLTALRVLLGAN